jgi:hypothetical protein
MRMEIRKTTLTQAFSGWLGLSALALAAADIQPPAVPNNLKVPALLQRNVLEPQKSPAWKRAPWRGQELRWTRESQS